jgi:hypothetical protein
MIQMGAWVIQSLSGFGGSNATLLQDIRFLKERWARKRVAGKSAPPHRTPGVLQVQNKAGVRITFKKLRIERD